MDLILSGESSSLLGKNSIDVPSGPMRQLKPADKFDFKATLSSFPGQVFKTIGSKQTSYEHGVETEAAMIDYSSAF